MRMAFAHAALLASAACACVVGISCRPAAEDRSGGPVTLEFTRATGDDRIGEVNVYPLDREVLAELESSRPSAAAWQQILSIRVGDSASQDTSVLPVFGTYAVSADTLRFRPRFRPAAGVPYTARFDGTALYRHIGRPVPPSLSRLATTTWRYDPLAVAPSTVVRAIYPTTDVVPMNLLRMYVEFSAPMSSGRSYEYVKLYTEDGTLVPDAFFTAGDEVELWDPEHTRLTILFDPGRIKRDLRPHEELGLPLRDGMRYQLVIDQAWPDAEGRPLVQRYVKRFRVGPQDRTLVRTGDWQMTVPRAGTSDSLVVTFPEPLDRALLARMLTVHDSSGALVPGALAVSEAETRWAFAPRDRWQRRPHVLRVDTELEDLAGNNLEKLFDVAPQDTAARGVSAPVVELPFVPGSER